MLSGTLTIDQAPSRASYGLLTTSAQLSDTVQRQRAVVMENIGKIAARGDRLAKFQNKANWIEEMAAERDDTPLTVAVKYIDRPIISYQPPSRGQLDISV